MQIARGQNILFMDADGATKISDVEKLESELQRISSGQAYLIDQPHGSCGNQLPCLSRYSTSSVNEYLEFSRILSQDSFAEGHLLKDQLFGIASVI